MSLSLLVPSISGIFILVTWFVVSLLSPSKRILALSTSFACFRFSRFEMPLDVSIFVCIVARALSVPQRTVQEGAEVRRRGWRQG